MSEHIAEPSGIPHQDATAVSIFDQAAGLNDFPVLKAFQQYIDAEQAKARKRMLGLSVFFILLLIVIVVMFTLVVMSIINRNQALSDRLLDMALRERNNPQPVVNVQPPAPQIVQPVQAVPQENALKPVLEKLESFVATLAARQQPVAPAPVVVTTAAPAAIPAAVQQTDSAEIARMREELKKHKADLEAEHARLKETQEKLKQAEIEKHRRRLYPEYYAQKEAQSRVPAPEAKPAPAAAASKPLSQLKPINYFAQEDDDLEDLVRKSRRNGQTSAKPVPAQETKTPAKPAAAANVPAPAKKPAKRTDAPSAKPAARKNTAADKTKTETLNIGDSAGDSIPWLIEQQTTP